jgi:hypothetical protein
VTQADWIQAAVLKQHAGTSADPTQCSSHTTLDTHGGLQQQELSAPGMGLSTSNEAASMESVHQDLQQLPWSWLLEGTCPTQQQPRLWLCFCLQISATYMSDLHGM